MNRQSFGQSHVLEHSTPSADVESVVNRPFQPIPGGAAHNLWQPARFDSSLIRKYDRPGPRYTSYPTAPQFKGDFGPWDYEDLLVTSAGPGRRPLSLYVHIPFCRTLCFYCGCNVTVSRSPERSKGYLSLLEREVARVSELADGEGRETVQIHWGGGTPTFLPPEDLARLMAILRRHFRLAEGCEIGVEVDPRQCTPEHLDVLAEVGVNRLSMGLQDLDPKVQAAVNRVQSKDQTWSLLDGARGRGMSSLNIDLIYGLPCQTPGSFAATVREVVAMAPDRVAVFNFAHLPSLLPHHKVLDTEALPDSQTKLVILEETIAELTEAGYVFIGMDHFAKPEDPLARALFDGSLTRNFQGYTTCGETDLLGFGVSSIGQIDGGYAQNHKTLAEYGKAILEGHLATWRGLVASREDLLRRDVIMRLMCDFHLRKRQVEECHGVDFDEHFQEQLDVLAPMAEDGLLEMTVEDLTVTPRGRLLVRNIAMVFDAYLEDRAQASYSRTV